MSKKIVIALVAMALLLVPVSVSAKSDKDVAAEKAVTAATHKANILAKKEARIAAKIVKQIAKLKKLGNRMVSKDQKHLDKLVVKANAKKTLTADQKASIVAQIQAEKAALATLLAKIHADTDLNTLKADVASISTVGKLNSKYLKLINAPAVKTTATPAPAN